MTPMLGVDDPGVLRGTGPDQDLCPDRQAGQGQEFQAREISGKTVKLEVMDIERLHRHWSEGKPRDEHVVNFEEVARGRPSLRLRSGRDG